MIRAKALERFHSNYRVNEKGCWIWIRGCSVDGYAQFRRTNASRFVASEILNEEIEGKEVCHRCDEPACVNPAHLFVGTHADNMRDMVAKSRHAKAALYGPANPMAKLSNESVLAIADALRRGDKQTDIARAFSISSTVVSMINCGKRWRHLTGTTAVRAGRKVVRRHDTQTIERAANLLRSGLSATEVSRTTGIARTTAQRIAAKEVSQ